MAADKNLDKIFSLRASSLPSEEENKAFFSAAKDNDLKKLGEFLEKWPKAAVNWIASDTPVIPETFNKTTPETLTYLIEHGADVDAFDTGKFWSAMHLAAHRGSVEDIEKLVRAGAKIDVPNNNDITPLMFAVEKRKLACVDLLVLLGADPGRRDFLGKSALDKAADDEVRDAIAAAQKRRADFLAAPTPDEPVSTPEETCIKLLSLIQLKKPEPEQEPKPKQETPPPRKKPWYKLGG